MNPYLLAVESVFIRPTPNPKPDRKPRPMSLKAREKIWHDIGSDFPTQGLEVRTEAPLAGPPPDHGFRFLRYL